MKFLKTSGKIICVIFPVVCWLIKLFSWVDIQIIDASLLSVLTILFYILAAAFILSLTIANNKTLGIICILAAYVGFVFLSLEFVWIIAICLLPALFLSFYRQGYKTAGIVMVSLFSAFLLLLLPLHLIFKDFSTITKSYYYSPDNQYVAISYISNQGALGGNVYVGLYKNFSPFIIKSEELYDGDWAESIDVRWIDDNFIQIEGSVMDVKSS